MTDFHELYSRYARDVHRPSLDHEKATLERVRRFNRRRTQILAFAIACTLMPFAVVVNHRHPLWLMLRDAPQQAAFFAIVAGRLLDRLCADGTAHQDWASNP